MPITNLAIQRRRLHELQQLINESELQLFSIELEYGFEMPSGRDSFIIHGRQLNPNIVKRIADYGFNIQKVSALNEHTLIINVSKFATEKEKPRQYNFEL